jgi:hypothetical protein
LTKLNALSQLNKKTLEIERNNFKITKVICEKHSKYVHGERVKTFPVRKGTRQGYPMCQSYSIFSKMLEVLTRPILLL